MVWPVLVGPPFVPVIGCSMVELDWLGTDWSKLLCGLDSWLRYSWVGLVWDGLVRPPLDKIVGCGMVGLDWSDLPLIR